MSAFFFFFKAIYKISKKLLQPESHPDFSKYKLLIEHTLMYKGFQGKLLDGWLDLHHSLEEQPWNLKKFNVWMTAERILN